VRRGVEFEEFFFQSQFVKTAIGEAIFLEIFFDMKLKIFEEKNI